MGTKVVRAREYLLNRILRIDPDAVFNSPGPASREVPGKNSLDMEIKESLNRIKAEAVSADGKQVKYASLAASNLYQNHKRLVGQLEEFEYLTLNSREIKLAFWINLYNALVVDAVIQQKVLTSVTENWLGVLRFFHTAAYRVGGDRFSLTDIEHGILRVNSGFPYLPGPHFSALDQRHKAVIESFDARIHFALNCASNSCPPIAVYSPDAIDQQLDLATRNFINNDTNLDVEKQVISISRIFRWYGADFGGKSGILKFIQSHLNIPGTDGRERLNLGDFRIQYHAYDWGLNNMQ